MALQTSERVLGSPRRSLNLTSRTAGLVDDVPVTAWPVWTGHVFPSPVRASPFFSNWEKHQGLLGPCLGSGFRLEWVMSGF